MKVSKLMEVLKKLNPDDEVVLDMNPFGGGYRKVSDYEVDLMFTESREIYTKKTATECELNYVANCVVLNI